MFKEVTMYAVRVGGKFVRVRSYGGFALVDHPARGTLYGRARDAWIRRGKAEDEILGGEVKGVPVGDHSSVRVVSVRLTCEVSAVGRSTAY